MSRRATLPGASELFRPTGPQRAESVEPGSSADEPSAGGTPRKTASSTRAGDRKRKPATAPTEERRSTGREKHDEKITVYVSATELLDLERARLTLRAEHGLAVDRGRIVREALAILLSELETAGEDSALVRRLRE